MTPLLAFTESNQVMYHVFPLVANRLAKRLVTSAYPVRGRQIDDILVRT